MTGKTERVILVKGDATKWYEQAIFIVNTNADAMPVDFVAEAEKIISDYNLNNENKKPVSKNVVTSPVIVKSRHYEHEVEKPSIILGVLMLIACIAIVAIFTYGLLR